MWKEYDYYMKHNPVLILEGRDAYIHEDFKTFVENVS